MNPALSAPMNGLDFGMLAVLCVLVFIIIVALPHFLFFLNKKREIPSAIITAIVCVVGVMFSAIFFPIERRLVYQNWIDRSVKPYIEFLPEQKVYLSSYQIIDESNSDIIPMVSKNVQTQFHLPGEVFAVEANYSESNLSEKVCLYANIVRDSNEKKLYMTYKEVGHDLGDDIVSGLYDVVIHEPEMNGVKS